MRVKGVAQIGWHLPTDSYMNINELDNEFSTIVETWFVDMDKISHQIRYSVWPLMHDMLCTAQFGGPVLKASGRVQNTPFQLGDKSTKITDQHTAGGSVSQLSQLAKLSHWLTLSTKDITTSFCHYNKCFCFYLIKSWVYIISLTQ